MGSLKTNFKNSIIKKKNENFNNKKNSTFFLEFLFVCSKN